MPDIKTRIILNHGEWNEYSGKKAKAGEVVLVKVGTTQAKGQVAEPIWMMKVGDGSTAVQSLPWLVAPAADVYEWAKKANLDAADLPAIPGDKLGLTVTVTGSGNAITNASWDAAKNTITLTKGETFTTKTEFDNHTHVADDITDFETKVTTIVGGMGIASDEVVSDISDRLDTAEGEIDGLQTAVSTTIPGLINEKVSQSAYDAKIAELGKADSDLDTAVKAAQADATAAKTAIEAFLDESAATDDVINTLKEIQAGLDAGEASAESLLAEINKIKDGTTEVPKATNADTLDGKHANEFAEAGHNHDNVYSKLDHTHTVSEITDYATDVAAKIKVETDARVGAINGLQSQLDTVKGTADSALQQITTTENGGLKVTDKNKIDIDTSIVFVLDGGTASDLDSVG